MNRCPFPWLRGPHEAQTVKGKMACGFVLCEHEKCDQCTESSRKESTYYQRGDKEVSWRIWARRLRLGKDLQQKLERDTKQGEQRKKKHRSRKT